MRKAYNLVYGMRKSSLTSVSCCEGETIEHKVKRMVRNGEAIKDGAPDIYTERKDGVMAGYDVRTDRFEVAVDAMDKMAKSKAAKSQGKGKVVQLDIEKQAEEIESAKGKGTGGESTKEK